MKKSLVSKIIIVSFIMIIVIISSTITIFSKSNEKIVVNSNVKTTNKTELKNVRQIIKKQNIVFLGDSITLLFPTNEVFNDMPVINSGLSGYKTTDILEKMDDLVYKYNPTKVILLIGINDIYEDRSEENQKKVLNNIIKIIEKIKKNRPKSKIYIESIYPINPNSEKYYFENDDNDIIEVLNKEIRNYSIKNDITYINIHDELLDDEDNFSNIYSDDGLHPNKIGYTKITSLLIPYLLED